MTDIAPILVIAAAGKIGSRIVARLQASGTPVRAASRSTNPAFDWDNQSTWAPALAGIEVAFVAYIPDLAVKGSADAIRAFTETAKRTGLKHLVLLSGRGESNAMASEKVVQASGIGYTIVRGAWFNQNFSEGVLLDSVREGHIALPAEERKEPFVDANDIADVAVAALLDRKHAGQIYEMTGPRLLTLAEVAAEINAAAGLNVRYEHMPLQEFHELMLSVMDKSTADFLHDLCEEVFDGRNESLGDGVQRALGREPRDFREYAAEVAASGVWKA